jgi:XTP/dITP diphosphohydrolase/tetrapyrrole methylase family protein/MazG family protein
VSEIQRLREIVAKLRAPDGCPWDIEQTHQSLSCCLVEETSEVLETIDNEDMPAMREELGDLLLQVVMHSQIAEESESFDLEDVAREINEKLIRRHPHVFGEGAELESADEVLARWDEIKAAEKVAKGLPINKRKIFRDLPPRLPALLFALDVFKRAEKAGLEAKASSNETEGNASDTASDENKMGRELFLLVSACRKAGIDPEAALRRYASKIVEELEPQASLEKD